MQTRLRVGPTNSSPPRGSPPSSQSRPRPAPAGKFKTATSSQFNLDSRAGMKAQHTADGVSLPTGATSFAGDEKGQKQHKSH